MKELKTLLLISEKEPRNSQLLVRISELYLDLGDDHYTKTDQKITAYEKGSKAAEKAIRINDSNPKGHFFYAANLGSASRLKGKFASLFIIQKLKTHVERALELKRDFALALHMKGMLLEELPWILGGDAKEALHYLQKAVEVKSDYSRARLDLARAYLKRNKFEEARRELTMIMVDQAQPDNYAWTRKYRPEAEKLLLELETHIN